MPPPPPLPQCPCLRGLPVLSIYLFIICCFSHSHRRNDHFKLKSKRLLQLERGRHPGGSNAIFYLQREKGAEVYVR